MTITSITTTNNGVFEVITRASSPKTETVLRGPSPSGFGPMHAPTFAMSSNSNKAGSVNYVRATFKLPVIDTLTTSGGGAIGSAVKATPTAKLELAVPQNIDVATTNKYVESLLQLLADPNVKLGLATGIAPR